MNNLSKIQNSKVIVRTDYNVKFDSKSKSIVDTTRLTRSASSIKTLLQNNNKIVICSHFGRPDPNLSSKENQIFSLQQIIPELEKILGVKIKFITKYPSQELQKALTSLNPHKEIILLENTRFFKQEKENDSEWAETISKGFDYFVFDAFGASHREHSTTHAIQKFLPSLKGDLVSQELKQLNPLLKSPQKPLNIVLGGAKIKTKIGIIKNFLDKADHILIGGALANTFLKAQGYEVGQSKYEPEKLEVASEIFEKAKNSSTKLILPIDYVTVDGSVKSLLETTPKDSLLDIGPLTITRFQNILKDSQTIIFNGPVGVFSKLNYSKGTKLLLETISENKNTTILGGGDTLDALQLFEIPQAKFTHVSTGGGAMLKYLEGKTLPTLEKLK